MSLFTSWTLNVAYALLLVMASPWILWAAITKGKYREGFAAKFLGSVSKRKGERQCVWLHAVSVGEVNLLATTLAELTKRWSELDVVISTTTKTGYDLAQRKYGDRHTVFYCPLDFSWAVHRAMRRVRPDLLVLAELELWPNLIAVARRQGARVAIINGRLSDKSFRGYRRFRFLTGRVLRQLDLIAAQDEVTAVRFRELYSNGDQVVVTGSLKYDGAQTDRHNSRTNALRELAGFKPEDVVWLAGSTQSPEEEIAIRIFEQLSPCHPELRLVLVPRHPERFDEVARLLDESNLLWQRRSKLPESPSPHSRVPSPQILLVDTVGELGAWWGTASIGFVGGSFGDRGGQNMIEPAAYGVATSFGPNTWNFRDIVAALLAADGARVVESEPALRDFVEHCLIDEQFRDTLGQRAREFMISQLGATARTVDLLEALLPGSEDSQSAAA